MKQSHKHDTFIDEGMHPISNVAKGFEKIPVHLALVAKHDGRHKARSAAGGHLTTKSSVCSEVFALKGLRMNMFLAELSGMEACATDTGNACRPKAMTQEKTCTKEWFHIWEHMISIALQKQTGVIGTADFVIIEIFRMLHCLASPSEQSK